MENQSEVARIRRQIELEYEAVARGFTGYAVTAKHEFITARMERIGALQQELSRHIGYEQAMEVVVQASNLVGTQVAQP